jgi:hypothetical protein
MRSLADVPAAAADLKRRTRLYWGVAAGQALATIALVLIVSVFSGLAAATLFLLSVATYVPACIAVWLWLMRFKCPRCHHRWFKLVGGTPPPFATKCGSCGLPKS